MSRGIWLRPLRINYHAFGVTRASIPRGVQEHPSRAGWSKGGMMEYPSRESAGSLLTPSLKTDSAVRGLLTKYASCGVLLAQKGNNIGQVVGSASHRWADIIRRAKFAPRTMSTRELSSSLSVQGQRASSGVRFAHKDYTRAQSSLHAQGQRASSVRVALCWSSLRIGLHYWASYGLHLEDKKCPSRSPTSKLIRPGEDCCTFTMNK
ncbi:hypothetical protein ACLB2K_052098 [Fragaria x ananassa]